MKIDSLDHLVLTVREFESKAERLTPGSADLCFLTRLPA